MRSIRHFGLNTDIAKSNATARRRLLCRQRCPRAAGLSGDLLDPQARRRGQAERATDSIRDRFGADAIVKGRALR